MNRLTNMLDGIGTTAFRWTDGDQLASEDGPWASDTVSYTYTNRLRSALSLAQPNASPWVQDYGYSYMRLASVASPAGQFDYTYLWDVSDRVQDLDYPGYADRSYPRTINSYDGLARLSDSTLYESYPAKLNEHGYYYDAGNQRTQQVFAADSLGSYRYVNYTYDKIGQLKTAKGYEHAYSVDTGLYDETLRPQEQFGYEYDAAWNLSRRTNDAMVQTFNVDSRNQLSSASRSGTFTVAGRATEPKGYAPYGYDGVTNVTVSGTGLSSGAAQLFWDGTWAKTNATLANGDNTYTATAEDTYGRTAQDSVTVNLPSTGTFVYDLNGNLRTNNTRIFEYDDENQLTRITEPGAWKSEFSYDGLLRRRVRTEYVWNGSSWVTNAVVRYVYDGMLVIQERDGNNVAQVTYTRGQDLSGSFKRSGGIGGLLARTDNSAFNAQLPDPHAYYHCDGNGNITCLINSNAQVVARYDYDPYGNIIGMAGPLAEANTYRFSSKEYHAASALYYYGYRFYSPTLQRWLNRDPIGEAGGINLHTFINNHCENSIDPFGFCDSSYNSGVYIESEIFGPERFANWVVDKLDKLIDKLRHSGNPFNRGIGAAMWGGSWLFGPGELKAAKEAAAIAKLNAALEKRHIALDALNAAEEAVAARMPALREAEKDLLATARRYEADSPQVDDAFQVYDKLHEDIEPFLDGLKGAQQNWQKANEQVKFCTIDQ